MPSRLPENEEDIPIARFGSSPQGRKNELYRKGLSLRSGKFMQTISGVHYNRSYSPDFWETMRKMIAPNADPKTFINEGYLHLVRNFIKYRWLLVVFCGASPTKDPSYGCKAMNPQHSKALSLRLSRCGYSNPAKIHVTYNRFQDHLQNLKTAVETVHPPYRNIDLAHPGEQVQLNDHLLQIGNEYYFPIRLKPPKPYDDLVEALSEHGVEYIEVRIFDLNPFEATGVKTDALYFSDLLLMYCLLQESPEIDENELNISTENQQRVALEGQDFSLLLKRSDGSAVTLEDWSNELLKGMEPLAELMDTGSQQKKYSKALANAQAAMKDRTLLSSFRILKEMAEAQQNFIDYGLAKAQQHLTSLDQ
jgi:glutamate--cysteine ligase